MTKHVYELTAADLEGHPVWVFPMDETVNDETSVRPVAVDEVVPDGLQTLVRCTFHDRFGRAFVGYAYSGNGTSVDSRRPVAWVGDLCVTFWNGMVRPAEEYVATISGKSIGWPLTYRSDASSGPLLLGELEGIYYLSEGDEIEVERISPPS